MGSLLEFNKNELKALYNNGVTDGKRAAITDYSFQDDALCANIERTYPEKTMRGYKEEDDDMKEEENDRKLIEELKTDLQKDIYPIIAKYSANPKYSEMFKRKCLMDQFSAMLGPPQPILPQIEEKKEAPCKDGQEVKENSVEKKGTLKAPSMKEMMKMMKSYMKTTMCMMMAQFMME